MADRSDGNSSIESSHNVRLKYTRFKVGLHARCVPPWQDQTVEFVDLQIRVLGRAAKFFAGNHLRIRLAPIDVCSQNAFQNAQPCASDHTLVGLGGPTVGGRKLHKVPADAQNLPRHRGFGRVEIVTGQGDEDCAQRGLLGEQTVCDSRRRIRTMATSQTNSAPASLRAAISWSGGKDSCLALLLAGEAGLKVQVLLTMVDPDGLSKSHALPEILISAQAQAMGVRAVFVPAGLQEYGAVFTAALTSLRDEGLTHMVFGDIDLQPHRDWLEPVCRRAGLVPVFPLWGMQRSEVARAIIARDIRAQVVCVDSRWLDASACGAQYDEELLARLPAGVCPCGENGEFHTFVWDAPCFDHPLRVASGDLRRLSSSPPLAPTELVFQTPVLLTG
jgi:diphthine-ammonia ligase